MTLWLCPNYRSARPRFNGVASFGRSVGQPRLLPLLSSSRSQLDLEADLTNPVDSHLPRLQLVRRTPGRSPEADDEELKGDDRNETEKNLEVARVWISGLESVNRWLGGRIRAMEPWPISYMLSRAARPMLAMRRGLDITPGPIRSGHTQPWAALGDAQFAAQSRRLPSVGVAGSTFSAKCPGLRAQVRKIGAACHRRDGRELQASTGLPRA